MTYKDYERQFRLKAFNNGYSEDIILKCLNYAKPLLDNNLPVIYNSTHLSALVGYNKEYIHRASLYTKYHYRTFNIKKKNGNVRTLSEPLPSLKEIQFWILQNILYNIKVSRFAKAYIPNKGIKDNIRFHRSQKVVLSLDIENFFPSISKEKIEAIFKNMGYNNLISSILSKLCYLKDVGLPQGAPTSPYLSNLVLKDFDSKVESYCLPNKIRYTRYADDLTFSGEFDPSTLTNIVKSELGQIGLKVNESKTNTMYQSQRQIVTGVVVNEKYQVPKEKRDEIRQAMYYINKYGLNNHLEKINCKKENYILHLIGKINYVLHINPSDQEFIKYRTLMYELKKGKNKN